MAALAGNHGAAVSRRHEGADAEPRARPDDADRRVFDCHAAADLEDVLRTEMRNRHCVCGEVVDHLQPPQAELRA